MERIEQDATPAEEWLQSLNATCNRLSTQYLLLLKAAAAAASASTTTTLDSDGRSTTAAAGGASSSSTSTATNLRVSSSSGGHKMLSIVDPPPPPLAANVGLAMIQSQLAAENICVATSQLLSLIRTVRVSLLVMDTETIHAEEQIQMDETNRQTQLALEKAVELEHQLYMEMMNTT